MAQVAGDRVCAACVHWKYRYDHPAGLGRGTCWEQVPAVLTREDDGCEAWADRLVNRAEVLAWFKRRGMP